MNALIPRVRRPGANKMDRVEAERIPATRLRVGEAWRLHKGSNVAVCIVRSHELGWKLVLRGGPMLFSKVCRSMNETLSTLEQWRTAMLERGWNIDG
jgi:hypothetical protein